MGRSSSRHELQAGVHPVVRRKSPTSPHERYLPSWTPVPHQPRETLTWFLIIPEGKSYARNGLMERVL